MELKVSAIIILVLFLINSSFSVFYKNNIRGDVNAGDEDKYSPIFVIKEEKKIEVVRTENNEVVEDETSQEENANQSTLTYNQPTQKQTETSPQEDTSPQEETPQEQPEPTPPPQEEDPAPPADGDGSDYAPPPSPLDDGFGIGV